MVVRKNAFLAFPSARNRGESKGGVESGRLKCPFSQVERGLDLQEIPKIGSHSKEYAETGHSRSLIV